MIATKKRYMVSTKTKKKFSNVPLNSHLLIVRMTIQENLKHRQVRPVSVTDIQQEQVASRSYNRYSTRTGF